MIPVPGPEQGACYAEGEENVYFCLKFIGENLELT
jgi:hypothetical protein